MSAARDKVIGSTIRNTAEMLRMETGKRRINSADVAPGAQVAPVVPVVRVASVVPEDLVVPAALVVPEDPAVLVALVVPENPAVRVASVVPEDPVVRVVQESPAVPVALEQELNRVEGPELVQVAVELARGQVEAVPEPDLVAVLLRTKSVTAAHHRGLVPAPRVEDSAAAAETTRVPVAAEVGTAWEAAATAVVVVAVAVAVEA